MQSIKLKGKRKIGKVSNNNEIQPKQEYRYRVHGWEITSEIPFIELRTQRGSAPDITICYGKVPEILENAKARGVGFQIKPGYYILNVPKVGRFMAVAGKEVTVEVFPGVTEDDLRVYLLGSIMGALAHQRGILSLHASSIKFKGKAILFAGDSGTGKSTLATAFYLKDCQVISEDMSAISFDSVEGALIEPGVARIKLWSDVLKEIPDEYKSNLHVKKGMEKYFLTIKDKVIPQPTQIQYIFILNYTNSKEVIVEQILGKEKFYELQSNVFRSQLIKGLGATKRNFRQLSELQAKVIMYRVHRPMIACKKLALADTLLKIIDP